MAKKTQSAIFGRAYRALEAGTAAECEDLIKELGDLVAAEQPELEATRPETSRPVYDGAGRIHGSELTDEGGETYLKALAADDEDELAKVANRHAYLSARAHEIDSLRHRLTARFKLVGGEEAKANAPGKAKKLARELGEALDVLEAAAEEYKAARANVEQLERDLRTQRALQEPGDNAGTLSALNFRRLGEALSHNLRRHITETGDPIMHRDTTAPHLFSSPREALERADQLLPPPSPSVIESVMSALGLKSRPDSPAKRHAIEKGLRTFQRARLALITRGDLDAAERIKVEDAVSIGE